MQGLARLGWFSVFVRMQLSSLKQLYSASGQCLYEGMGRNAVRGKPLEQAELCKRSLLSDSIQLFWRNMGCQLWSKDMVAVSSCCVTLQQLPNMSPATQSLPCIFCLLRKCGNRHHLKACGWEMHYCWSPERWRFTWWPLLSLGFNGT